jgi:site-specific DNA recombinase
MRRAIIYTRVSTEEQKASGFSLDHQKKSLENFCANNGMQVIAHYQDDFSAKNFNRPAWNALTEYVKTNKKNTDCVVFTRYDRFSRNLGEALTVMKTFRSWDIELISTEQQIDTNNLDSKLMLALNLILPEIENDKISQRTREGMREAKKQGCWNGTAPLGYKNKRDEKEHSTLEMNEKAGLVRQAFELVATGLYSCEEVRRIINKTWETKICKQGFIDILNKIVYTGMIFIPKWKKEEAQIVPGLHEPIVSKELYYKVQDFLYGRRKQPKFHARISIQLPLRGHLKCPECGGNLTGSGSTGRKKIKHWYYHCQMGCTVRFRADEANELFLKHLSNIKIPQHIKDSYIKSMRDFHRKNEGDKNKRMVSIQKEIGIILKRMESNQDMLADRQIAVADYNQSKMRYEEQITIKQMELSEIKIMDNNFLKYMEFTVMLIEKLDLFYELAPVNIKQRIVVSNTNELIEQITRKDNTFRVRGNEKADISVGLSSVALPAGLEPATL